MSGTLLTQLETTDTVPAGSLYMMEAGDGSGTKTVTQETLAKETGKALKVGDLEGLETEDKTSLVAAINEAAQTGGGAAVDVLDTREEIEANTESGKGAGALAVKEMFGELNSNFAYDVNGIYGYRRKVNGADTVIPFRSNPRLVLFKHAYENSPKTYSYTADRKGKATVIVENMDSAYTSQYTRAKLEVMKNGGIIFSKYNAGRIVQDIEVELDIGDVISITNSSSGSSIIYLNAIIF